MSANMEVMQFLSYQLCCTTGRGKTASLEKLVLRIPSHTRVPAARLSCA
mgnify:CR=1 FL=1